MGAFLTMLSEAPQGGPWPALLCLHLWVCLPAGPCAACLGFKWPTAPWTQALGGRTLLSQALLVPPDQGEDPRVQDLSWLLGQEAVGPGHSWARADTEGFYTQPNVCVCPSISS